MTDQDRSLAAIVVALNNIHAELKSLNQAMSRPGASAAAAPARPYAPRPSYNRRPEGEEGGGEFAPKRSFRASSPGGPGRPAGPGRPPKTGGASGRSPRSSSGPSPLPRKKGDGYPKKPR